MVNMDEYKVVSENVDFFIDNKQEIVEMWVSLPVVATIFKQHGIDAQFFGKHFGIRVIDYFIGVIEGREKIGNCPVIIVMLIFFKRKNISLFDVYSICANFRNSISVCMIEKQCYSKEFYLKTIDVIDWNFRGVMGEYIRKNHKNMLLDAFSESHVNIEVDEKGDVVETPVEDTEPKKQEELQTYTEEVLDTDLITLEELEQDIEGTSVMLSMGSASADDVNEMGDHLIQYGRTLTAYPLFQALGEGLSNFGEVFIQDFQQVADDPKKLMQFSVIMENFVNDLLFWRKQLFVEGVGDPNQYDASILSSLQSMVKLLQGASDADDSDDLELF